MCSLVHDVYNSRFYGGDYGSGGVELSLDIRV